MAQSEDCRAALRGWLLNGALPRPEAPELASRIVAEAERQRVAGLLHVALGPEAEGWPETARARLRAIHHESFLRGERQLDLAQRVLVMLENAGLRALPLKGAALVERLYGSVAERPMVDVDILVLDDWPAAVHLSRAAGFREGLRGDHAWTFLDPDGHGAVELHHSVTSCPGLYALDRNGLWERSEPRPGQVRRAPSPADLLAQLGLHAAFQSGLVLSLVQYLDFRRLMERSPPDIDGLLAISARTRTLPVLAVALEAARVVVGAPVPERLTERLRSHIPKALRPWVGRFGRNPLDLVEPADRPIARLRWGLAAGHRARLVLDTVAPSYPGEPGRHWRRTARIVPRSLQLAGRWLTPMRW